MFHLTFSFSVLWVIHDRGFWVSLKHLWLTLLQQRGGKQLDRVKRLFNNWNWLSFLTVSCILLTILPFFFSLAVNSSLLNRTMVLSEDELVSPSSELVSSPWEVRDHRDCRVPWCHSAGKLWIMRRKWSLRDHICLWGRKEGETQSNNPFWANTSRKTVSPKPFYDALIFSFCMMPPCSSQIACPNTGRVYTATLQHSLFPAGQHHHWLGSSDSQGVLEVWGSACWQQLWLCPWHHPHVFHPLLRHLHLLHGPEEIQDQSLLSHHCKYLLSPHQSSWGHRSVFLLELLSCTQGGVLCKEARLHWVG